MCFKTGTAFGKHADRKGSFLHPSASATAPWHPACVLIPCAPQVLLGHPPSYTTDVAAPVSAVSLPPAVLSPPLPDTLLPTVPELLPKLPSSLAPTVVAASQSAPTQTSTLLPPTNPPLPTGPAVAGPCPAVQLTVEVAQEVCAPLSPAQATWGLSPQVREACRRHRGLWNRAPPSCFASRSALAHIRRKSMDFRNGFSSESVCRLPRAFANPACPF